ncbi:MAG: hypothetical protein EA424_06215 [Planctomycetaceae bacterium]|nr:MAG: hypothetical protein EA424_06215 [Planctomycetaceae bacterium]
MKVGFDSYCYHRYFGEIYPDQTDPGIHGSFHDFVRRAGELEADRSEKAWREMNALILKAACIGAQIMRIVASSLMFRFEPHGPQIEAIVRMLKESVGHPEGQLRHGQRPADDGRPRGVLAVESDHHKDHQDEDQLVAKSIVDLKLRVSEIQKERER